MEEAEREEEGMVGAGGKDVEQVGRGWEKGIGKRLGKRERGGGGNVWHLHTIPECYVAQMAVVPEPLKVVISFAGRWEERTGGREGN